MCCISLASHCASNQLDGGVMALVPILESSKTLVPTAKANAKCKQTRGKKRAPQLNDSLSMGTRGKKRAWQLGDSPSMGTRGKKESTTISLSCADLSATSKRLKFDLGYFVLSVVSSWS